jgi:ATP-binding cassette subfamily F protein 3
MVSHDRYLIEACAERLWIVADRTVTNYDGDLDEYRRLVLSSRNAEPAPRERSVAGEKPQRPKSDTRGSLKKRVVEAEAEIARVSEIIAKIDTALALPDIFTRDPKQAAQLSKARANATEALARAEESWLAASAQLEEVAS